MVITAIGSFSVGGGIIDIYLMLGVCFVAYFMNMMKYPIAPLVIGVILGGLFDETFRRSLFLSDGNLSVFVSRPGAAVLLALNIALIAAQIPALKRGFARLRGKEV
jgi:putative tricarboxylic transport membrane protein